MFELIIEYFKEDPLKAIYLIGGSGGIWYWINQWRYRTRIKINIESETYNPAAGKVDVNLKVEAINLGNIVTSLERVIVVSGTTVKGEERHFNLVIKGIDRSLPPHEPKYFNIEGSCAAAFPFTWYRKYNFSITRGWSCNKYILDMSKKEISWLNYIWNKGLILINKHNEIKKV